MSLENKKIRVAVLLGGDTNEREISLESGRNVCYKLSTQKYEVIPVFVNNNLELFKLSQKLLIQNSTKEINALVTQDVKIKLSDLPNICDFVFIGLHGGIGENGCIQGALEMLGMPYNGSGVLASSLCMDKFKTNQFLRLNGIAVGDSVLLDKTVWLEKRKDLKEQELENFIKFFLAGIKFPLISKPHDDGCSIFVKKINNLGEFIFVVDDYFANTEKNKLMLEELIAGMELTVGVFGNDDITVLPPSKAVANKEILSIEEKFLPGAGENLTPAPLPSPAIEFVQQEIGRTYKILGCKGYSRIDCFYQDEKISPTGKQRLVILEPNTLPGLTPATCIFHQAAEIGMKPMEFIDKIVELGLELHKTKEIQKDHIITENLAKEKELKF